MTKAELEAKVSMLEDQVRILQETMVMMGGNTNYVPYPVQQPYRHPYPNYPYYPGWTSNLADVARFAGAGGESELMAGNNTLGLATGGIVSGAIGCSVN